jgi:hypothetical protein
MAGSFISATTDAARGDRRRVEATVEVPQDSLHKLLVLEAKHHNAPQHEIQEVEAQA